MPRGSKKIVQGNRRTRPVFSFAQEWSACNLYQHRCFHYGAWSGAQVGRVCFRLGTAGGATFLKASSSGFPLSSTIKSSRSLGTA